MGVSKESISKFLIGNRFHVKLRILSPYSNRFLAYTHRGKYILDLSWLLLIGKLHPCTSARCAVSRALWRMRLPRVYWKCACDSTLCSSRSNPCIVNLPPEIHKFYWEQTNKIWFPGKLSLTLFLVLGLVRHKKSDLWSKLRQFILERRYLVHHFMVGGSWVRCSGGDRGDGVWWVGWMETGAKWKRGLITKQRQKNTSPIDLKSTSCIMFVTWTA